jgi:outer membrane protein TolC
MSQLIPKITARLATITCVNGCPMRSRIDPTATTRGHRFTLSGFTPWIIATPACLIIAVLVMAGVVLDRCRPAQGAEVHPAAQTVAPGSPLTFEEAVKIAITQSPSFTKSSVDIEIRKMDETDSRMGLIPPLNFNTVYYVNRPSGSGYGPPYSLNFTTQPYNPVGAYFTLQAHKLATRAAILAHLSSISSGLENLGNLYMKLESLHKMAGIRQEMVALCQENLAYAENRLAIGTATSLEVKVAQRELQLARGRLESITLAHKRTITNLHNFLGLPPNQPINPVYKDSRRQVLGNFDPASVTLEEAKHRSYDLKVLDIYKELQTYHIRLAIAKAFPTLIFNTQTPDPLSVTNARGLYVGFGIQVPVWDGFTRIRDISRQKAILRQVDSKKEVRENVLEDKCLDAKEAIQQKHVLLKNAQSLEEVARLKAHESEVRYHSGEAPLPILLERRKEVLKAQEEAVSRESEYNKEVLRLRELCGDLGHTYVNENSWKK